MNKFCQKDYMVHCIERFLQVYKDTNARFPFPSALRIFSVKQIKLWIVEFFFPKFEFLLIENYFFLPSNWSFFDVLFFQIFCRYLREEILVYSFLRQGVSFVFKDWNNFHNFQCINKPPPLLPLIYWISLIRLLLFHHSGNTGNTVRTSGFGLI